jgi:hypothetical protein
MTTTTTTTMMTMATTSLTSHNSKSKRVENSKAAPKPCQKVPLVTWNRCRRMIWLDPCLIGHYKSCSGDGMASLPARVRASKLQVTWAVVCTCMVSSFVVSSGLLTSLTMLDCRGMTTPCLNATSQHWSLPLILDLDVPIYLRSASFALVACFPSNCILSSLIKIICRQQTLLYPRPAHPVTRLSRVFAGSNQHSKLPCSY